MIEIRPFSPGLSDEWARVCRESSDAWFWHTRDWAEYQRSYARGRFRADLSFAVLDRGRVGAVCPVFLEEAAGLGAELAYGGGEAPAPAAWGGRDGGRRRRLVGAAYAHLDELAGRHGAGRVRVAYPALPEGGGVAARLGLLQEHGYLDASHLTQVIDLSRGRDALWGDVRSSYRPLIRRGGRELAITVHDAGRPPGPAFEAYRQVHAAAAGRATRPDRTFELMDLWVGRGQALLVEATLGGRPAAYALVLCHGGGAYYGSGCSAPGLGLPYLMHTLQWACVTALLERGHRWYEVGHQHLRPTLAHPAGAKERSIGFFKRGLGGGLHVRVAGESYASPAIHRRVVEDRLRAYESAAAPGG